MVTLQLQAPHLHPPSYSTTPHPPPPPPSPPQTTTTTSTTTILTKTLGSISIWGLCLGTISVNGTHFADGDWRTNVIHLCYSYIQGHVHIPVSDTHHTHFEFGYAWYLVRKLWNAKMGIYSWFSDSQNANFLYELSKLFSEIRKIFSYVKISDIRKAGLSPIWRPIAYKIDCNLFTHLPLMPHICVSESGQH